MGEEVVCDGSNNIEAKIVMNDDAKNVIYRIYSSPLVRRHVRLLRGRQTFGAQYGVLMASACNLI